MLKLEVQIRLVGGGIAFAELHHVTVDDEPCFAIRAVDLVAHMVAPPIAPPVSPPVSPPAPTPEPVIPVEMKVEAAPALVDVTSRPIKRAFVDEVDPYPHPAIRRDCKL